MRSEAAQAWSLTLQRAAPAVQLGMLRMLAAVLAGPARSDALLVVAEGLDDAAKEMKLEGRQPIEQTLRRLAAVFRDEAPRRA